MAQVEILMYVALGFGTAALIALLLGRLVWRLAVGVGRRRAQRQATTPAVAQLQAERNQLRAEYAMLARKVEVRLDDLRRQVAEQMAEVSRSRNRIDRLSAEVETRDASLAERDREIARLKEHIALLEDELAVRTKSLHDLQLGPGAGDEAISDISGQLAERDRIIERLTAEVDRLGTARHETVWRERTVQERLKSRIEDLSELSRQIEAQRRQLALQQSHSQALRETLAEQREPEPATESGEAMGDGEADGAPLERRVEDAERQASALQDELDRLDQIWAAKLADVAQAVASEPSANGKPVEARPQAPSEPPLADPSPAEDAKKPASGLANVISLAQRIRALQRN
jgi:chromosome segregation ATPase